eukprot:COSAG01_NODE_334_length_18708_cov_49.649686_13_plen_98_part_00
MCGHRFQVLLAREGGVRVSWLGVYDTAGWRRRSSMCAAESKLNAYHLRVRILRVRTLDGLRLAGTYIFAMPDTDTRDTEQVPAKRGVRAPALIPLPA